MRKILVTGGRGMVGKALQHTPAAPGEMWVFVSSDDYDLTSQLDTINMFHEIRPNIVVHLAAKVGGVNGNNTKPADYFYDNLQINTNVLQCAHQYDVEKVVSILSTCIYPDDVKYPIKEEYLHNGEPHFTNYGYAYAKRMLEVQSRTLRAQHGRKYICLVPTNLYGPNDNFDLEGGHFVAALVRKMCDAKREGSPSITFWGDGSPLRQFTYVDNMAEAIIWAIDNYDGAAPLNVGRSFENSISELVQMAATSVGYEGDIIWDTTKPIGQYKKTVCMGNLRKAGYEEIFESTGAGIRKTCEWYQANYPNVRGL